MFNLLVFLFFGFIILFIVAQFVDIKEEDLLSDELKELKQIRRLLEESKKR